MHTISSDHIYSFKHRKRRSQTNEWWRLICVSNIQQNYIDIFLLWRWSENIFLLIGIFIFWVKKVQKWKINAYYLHRISFLVSDSKQTRPRTNLLKFNNSGKVDTFSDSQMEIILPFWIIFDKKLEGWYKNRIRSGCGLT